MQSTHDHSISLSGVLSKERSLSDGDQVIIDQELGLRLANAAKESTSKVRLGIVCMTKRPMCFETWLSYHVEIGVEVFYLRIEDTPGLLALIQQKRWKDVVRATFHTGNVRDWAGQSARQDQHVQDSIRLARQDGLTHLLHIDDDELLCCPHGIGALRAAIECIPGDVPCLHLRNMEALVPTDCTNPFAEARCFRHDPNDYGAYGRAPCSGKSIGALSVDGLHPNGPHFFRMESGPCTHTMKDARHVILPPASAVIIHYESCIYDRWRDKFTEFARQDSGGRAGQFSSFNRASIEACKQMLHARAARESGNPHTLLDHISTGDVQQSARRVWSEWRCEPSGLPPPPPAGQVLILKDRRVTKMAPPAAGVNVTVEGLEHFSVQPPECMQWRVVHRPFIVVRDTPGLSGLVIGQLPANVVIDVDGEQGGWLRIAAHCDWQSLVPSRPAYIRNHTPAWVLINGASLGLGELLQPLQEETTQLAERGSVMGSAARPLRPAIQSASAQMLPHATSISIPKQAPSVRSSVTTLVALANSAGLPQVWTERFVGESPNEIVSDVDAVQVRARAVKMPLGLCLRLVLAARTLL